MIDCKNIAEATVWSCRIIESSDGGAATELSPPVTFWDGAVIPVYVIQRNSSVEITDDGGLIEHFESTGLAYALDGRRTKTIDKILAPWGVGMSSELHMVCNREALQHGLQQYLGAMFALARWEVELRNQPPDNSLLIAEAEMYLAALNPNFEIYHDIRVSSISGRGQDFPLRIDDTLYDAVGIHHASSAAMVKKLVDVRGLRDNKSIAITVVVDDRADHERAGADIQLYSQFAHIDKMSALQKRASGVMQSRLN